MIDLKRHLCNQLSYPICLQTLLQAGTDLEIGPGGPLPLEAVDFQLILSSSLRPEQVPQAAEELVAAARRGDVEVVDALLDAGADTDWQDGDTNQTALSQACASGAEQATFHRPILH